MIQPHQRSSHPFKVLFVLQPHFSLLAFTACADALTTANLVTGETHFVFQTVSLDIKEVVSDLGIVLSADFSISSIDLASSNGPTSADPTSADPTSADPTSADPTSADPAFNKTISEADAIMVCGGYRCDLTESTGLTQLLRLADRQQKMLLGGIWNGAVALAHAQLLDGYAFTVHPASVELVRTSFPALMLRRDTFVADRQRLSASGPNSAFDLMLLIIQRQKGVDTTQAIRDILKADTPSGEPGGSVQLEPDIKLPDALHTALQLMRSNLDEPLDKADLARHINVSTRAMERLFERYLNTSPAKHYMQLRLQRAHELLHQTDLSVAAISEACGFVSSAHFSRAFSRQYNMAPSQMKSSVHALLNL